jgi:hypothetical protein
MEKTAVVATKPIFQQYAEWAKPSCRADGACRGTKRDIAFKSPRATGSVASEACFLFVEFQVHLIGKAIAVLRQD